MPELQVYSKAKISASQLSAEKLKEFHKQKIAILCGEIRIVMWD